MKESVYHQQTKNLVISPTRGTIYDSTGKQLAVSAPVDTVTINPSSIVVTDSDENIATQKTEELKQKVAKAFSDIFGLNYEETLEKVKSTSSIETIAKKVETDKITQLTNWMKENDIYSGINIDDDTKRYYPYSNLASNLIGFCGDSNQGLEGLEYAWNSVLTGTQGKITTSKDANSDVILDKDEKYIPAENGSNITLTIDVNIQTIAEKYLKQAVEDNNCGRGGNLIIMDPTNGDILAMATYPDYNLNEPFTPNATLSQNWDSLSSESKSNALSSMWRNKAVSDTYEPGSVFKVITASAALEENITTTDTPNDFFCMGYEDVSGIKIGCASSVGHGSQSLRNALENSCNPALIQLGSRIGAENMEKYMRAFGFFDKTGIDTSGEAVGAFFSNVGPVELATTSFGQRFTITPLQMITAVCAIANDGLLYKPRIVKQVENTDTGAISTIEPEVVRQVISKETAEQVRDMMQSVVENGGGKYGQIKGYTIGGKTGTSEPNPNDPEAGYVSSFVAIAPVDNTKVVVLLTLYDPQGDSHFGSQIAAPVVSKVLAEVLPYLGIQSSDTSNTDVQVSENYQTSSLPDVRNKTIAEAKKILENAGFTCSFNGSNEDLVTEQVPIQGSELISGATIKLYSTGNDARVSVTVPDLKGMTLAQANNSLKAKGLNIKFVGSESGKVVLQEPIKDSSVEEGSIVTITLDEEIKNAN